MEYLVKMDKDILSELEHSINNELDEIKATLMHYYYGDPNELDNILDRYAALKIAVRQFNESHNMYDPIKLNDEFKDDN